MTARVAEIEPEPAQAALTPVLRPKHVAPKGGVVANPSVVDYFRCRWAQRNSGGYIVPVEAMPGALLGGLGAIAGALRSLVVGARAYRTALRDPETASRYEAMQRARTEARILRSIMIGALAGTVLEAGVAVGADGVPGMMLPSGETPWSSGALGFGMYGMVLGSSVGLKYGQERRQVARFEAETRGATSSEARVEARRAFPLRKCIGQGAVVGATLGVNFGGVGIAMFPEHSDELMVAATAAWAVTFWEGTGWIATAHEMRAEEAMYRSNMRGDEGPGPLSR